MNGMREVCLGTTAMCIPSAATVLHTVNGMLSEVSLIGGAVIVIHGLWRIWREHRGPKS